MERFSYKALYHSGTRGMHWGERNYQNKDGTWTELGKARRRTGNKIRNGSYIEYANYKHVNDEELINDLHNNVGHYDNNDVRMMNSSYSTETGKNAVENIINNIKEIYYNQQNKYERYVARHPDYNPDQDILKKYENGGWDALTDDEADLLDEKWSPSVSLIDAKKEANEQIININNSIPLKNNPTTIGQDLSVVNPSNSRSNCPACSMSYVLRRKGIDVSAGEINGLTSRGICSYLANERECFENVHGMLSREYFSANNTNADGTHKRSHTEIMSDYIMSKLNNTNAPQYGMLEFSYNSGGGHIFNWEYIPNERKILFVDGQAFVNPNLFLENVGRNTVKDDFNIYVNPEIDITKAMKDGIIVKSTGIVNPDFRR